MTRTSVSMQRTTIFWKHNLFTSMFYMQDNISLFILTFEFLDLLTCHLSISHFVGTCSTPHPNQSKTHMFWAQKHVHFGPFFSEKTKQRGLKWFWPQCRVEFFGPPLFRAWYFYVFRNWPKVLSGYVLIECLVTQTKSVWLPSLTRHERITFVIPPTSEANSQDTVPETSHWRYKHQYFLAHPWWASFQVFQKGLLYQWWFSFHQYEPVWEEQV